MKVLFFILLISSGVYSQHTGFFGSKTYIELNTLSHIPIINNLIFSGSTPYKATGNTLLEKRDWFEVGIRLAIGHSLKNNSGIGLEIGMDFQNLAAPEGGNNFDYSTNYIVKHEMLSVRTLVIMPKLEFANADGLLPIGLNHQVGIGFSSSKVVDKEYLIERNQAISYAEELDFAPISDGFKGITFLYAMNMRTALSKHLIINYGIRYTLNVVLLATEPLGTQSGYQISRNRLGQSLRSRRLHNALTFNFGLSIPI